MKIGPFDPLVCIRTVEISPGNEQAFFEWIQSGQALRERYGILLDPARLSGEPAVAEGHFGRRGRAE